MDSRKPLTAGEIEEIREMRAKATPGPVEFCVYGSKDKAWLKRELCNLVDSSPEAEFHFVGTPDGLVVAHTGNGPTSKDNARFLAVMLNEFDRLLSLLTPPPDAAVREAVKAGRECLRVGGWGFLFNADDLRTLLRAVQAPRLTPEQVEAVKFADAGLELAKCNCCAPGFICSRCAAKNALRAAFPELFAGEVGK